MNINGQAWRPIWRDGHGVHIIDQTQLPAKFETLCLHNWQDAKRAISEMLVRGAPLIGATAAYGVALAMRDDPSDQQLNRVCSELGNSRPTAVNLHWALQRMLNALRPVAADDRERQAFAEADALCEEDVEINRRIGEHGLAVLRQIHNAKQRPLNVLTHCNAGWLATVDWGTATSPIYQAHDAGIPLHVWVDETRPRLQGALTAWELKQHGVPHSYIVDNAGGLLMQQGKVDCCIVGCDRVAANGDVANKIGTYLKALAAKAHNVPFYVALPSPTFDANIEHGADIPIEERDAAEVDHIGGTRITASPVHNPGFDITPATYVTGYLTEHGLLNRDQLHQLTNTPER